MFSDVSVGAGTLSWIGTGSDQACRMVDMVTTGAACVMRCNQDAGYCYVGPAGCGGTGGSIDPFTPIIPTVIFRKETVNGIEICSKLPEGEQSGCPSVVYSCDDPSQMPWDTADFSEISLDAGKLKWVGTGSDPVCPTVDMVVEGSTCVKKCYPSGYCYVGPPGCRP